MRKISQASKEYWWKDRVLSKKKTWTGRLNNRNRIYLCAEPLVFEHNVVIGEFEEMIGGTRGKIAVIIFMSKPDTVFY